MHDDTVQDAKMKISNTLLLLKLKLPVLDFLIFFLQINVLSNLRTKYLNKRILFSCVVVVLSLFYLEMLLGIRRLLVVIQ